MFIFSAQVGDESASAHLDSGYCNNTLVTDDVHSGLLLLGTEAQHQRSARTGGMDCIKRARPISNRPIFSPRCRVHHSPSKNMIGALRRESAIREMLLDTSFDFARDECSPPRRYQAKSCLKRARISWRRGFHRHVTLSKALHSAAFDLLDGSSTGKICIHSSYDPGREPRSRC
jgi:hypothetical protein